MLGLLSAQLRPSWGQLGHTYAIIAPTWHQLGLSWGHLAANLGHHEAILEPTFATLKSYWAPFRPSYVQQQANFEPTSSNFCPLAPTGAIFEYLLDRVRSSLEVVFGIFAYDDFSARSFHAQWWPIAPITVCRPLSTPRCCTLHPVLKNPPRPLASGRVELLT